MLFFTKSPKLFIFAPPSYPHSETVQVELARIQMERGAEQEAWLEERQQAEFERGTQSKHITSLQTELSSAEREIERVS